MRYLLVTALLFGINGCSNRAQVNSQSTGLELVSTSRNEKYRLDVVFRGKKWDEAYPPVITEVVLRNEKGEEVRYHPIDEPSLTEFKGYFLEVWSPDEEYLVLPRGRFQGFCIIKAAAAFDRVRNSECDDFVRLREENGTGLWHEFQSWTSPSTVVFSAGLSHDFYKFQYDLPGRKLKPVAKSAPSMEGENKDGRVKVESN